MRTINSSCFLSLTSVLQFVLRLVDAPGGGSVLQVTVGEGLLRVLVEVAQVRVSGSGVQVIVQLLHVLTVVTLQGQGRQGEDDDADKVNEN